MIILIRDDLVNPPTWIMSFRDLTLYLTTFHNDDVLIESGNPDPYWHWLKKYGCTDFISDFIPPGTERGLHIDTHFRFPRTVVTDRIVPENFDWLITNIDFYRPKPDDPPVFVL